MNETSAGARRWAWAVAGLFAGAMFLLFAREPLLSWSDERWIRTHHAYVVWVAIGSAFALLGLLLELRPRSWRWPFQRVDSWTVPAAALCGLLLAVAAVLGYNLNLAWKQSVRRARAINELATKAEALTVDRDAGWTLARVRGDRISQLEAETTILGSRASAADRQRAKAERDYHGFMDRVIASDMRESAWEKEHLTPEQMAEKDLAVYHAANAGK